MIDKASAQTERPGKGFIGVDGARIGAVDASENSQKGGFSAAVWAHDADVGPFREERVNSAENVVAPGSDAIGFGKVSDFDHRILPEVTNALPAMR